MKKTGIYLIYFLALPSLFYWLFGGEINFYLPDVFRKGLDILDYNLGRGGFHRIAVIYMVTFPLFLFFFFLFFPLCDATLLKARIIDF